MPALPRVPFAIAIKDEQLLAKPWRKLSVAQQVTLKIFYGLPLEGEELQYWAAFQGHGVYDELGYLIGVEQIPPYQPKEYDTLTGILGRRAGKSDRIGGFIAAYEITLGGHLHSGKIREGQPVFWLYIAQDLDTAKLNMKFIKLTLDESPMLAKTIVNVGKEEIEFDSGIILKAEPPNIRTARGTPVVGVTMDEFGFWYRDAKSANPDYEVVAAVEYAMSQFENAKQVRLTTPWVKEGMAWEANQAGTEGKLLRCNECASHSRVCSHMGEEREAYEGHLVLKGTTALLGNPTITRKKLARLKKRDPEKFARESLAQFIDSLSGFLSHAAVDSAVDTHVTHRLPAVNINYVAAIDPAFRGDGFTFTILHNDAKLGIVQDFVKGWHPEPGERLNPATVLDEIKPTLDAYQLDFVFSDQYQLESLQNLASDRGFSIYGIDLTVKSKSQAMRELESQVNQRKLRLLDEPIQTLQLKQLVKTAGAGSYTSIAAPAGKKDDYALVLALAVKQTVVMPPTEVEAKAPPKPGTAGELKQHLLAEIMEQSMYDPVIQAQLEYRAYLEALTDDDCDPGSRCWGARQAR